MLWVRAQQTDNLTRNNQVTAWEAVPPGSKQFIETLWANLLQLNHWASREDQKGNPASVTLEVQWTNSLPSPASLLGSETRPSVPSASTLPQLSSGPNSGLASHANGIPKAIPVRPAK